MAILVYGDGNAKWTCDDCLDGWEDVNGLLACDVCGKIICSDCAAEVPEDCPNEFCTDCAAEGRE